METPRKKDGFKSEKLFVLPEIIFNELSEHELIRDLFITDIGYFPDAKHHFRERLAGSRSHIFIYCSNGEGWVELNGQGLIVINKHTLIIIPAGTPHRYGTYDSNPWSIYWFHLQGQQVKQFIHNFDLNVEPLKFPLSFYSKFIDCFEQCYMMLIDKPYSKLYHIQVSQTMRYLISTIGLTAVRSRQEEKREDYLETAIQYMTDHLDSTITLSKLASFLGLSRQHMIYIFNQETGLPPIDYFIRMKMQRACQMLDLTDMSVKEVSFSLGMKDPYYFSRSFKKVMGYSPTEYRKILKG